MSSIVFNKLKNRVLFVNMLLMLCLLAAAVGCSGAKKDTPAENKTVKPGARHGNGIYWWKTVFNPNRNELEFLKQHSIKRVYVKFFDVVPYSGEDDYIAPVATVRFDSPKPDGVEIVPVVFISTKAVRRMADIGGGAEKIVKRVRNMASYNNLGEVKELQLDCDYSWRDAGAFNNLCNEVRKLIGDSVVLSATIRVSQLKNTSSLPPVDRGVLMLYNTGSFKNYYSKNSILSSEDVELYLKDSGDFGLPLDLAFPAYRWGLWFDGLNTFNAILHTSDFSDTTLYSAINGTNRLSVNKDHFVDGQHIRKGDKIRPEVSDYNEIMKTKKLVFNALKDNCRDIILFHLDSAQLNQFNANEIDSIYNCSIN